MLCGWLLAATAIFAQAVKIQRFVPGNYLADDWHKVELAADAPIDISGYLLVTRDYSVRIPNDTKIYPGKTYTAAKKFGDLVLSRSKDFLIRRYSRAVEGNYVALFNRGGQMVDGFYHAQIPNVPFLPDSGVCILANYKPIAYKLPPEQLPIWGYFPLGDDPAVGYERSPDGWKPVAANPDRPRVAFIEFAGRFVNGAVMLKWVAQGENLPLRVERSYDQKRFETLSTLDDAVGEGRFFDPDPPRGATVYYRLSAGNAASRVLEIKSDENGLEFALEVLPKQAANAGDLSVRLYSGFSQRVRVKLYDERFSLRAALLDAWMHADTGHLLIPQLSLSPGTYWIVAETELRRYSAPFEIRP